MLLSGFGPPFTMVWSSQGAEHRREIDIYPDTHVTNIFDALFQQIKMTHPDAVAAAKLERRAWDEWMRMEIADPESFKTFGNTPIGVALRDEVLAYTAAFPVGIKTQVLRVLQRSIRSIEEVCIDVCATMKRREYRSVFVEGDCPDIYHKYANPDYPAQYTCLDWQNPHYRPVLENPDDANLQKAREAIWVDRIDREYRSPSISIVGVTHVKDTFGFITALKAYGFIPHTLPDALPDTLAELGSLIEYLTPFVVCKDEGMNAAQIDEFVLRRFGIPDYTSSCAPITPGFCWPHSRSASP